MYLSIDESSVLMASAVTVTVTSTMIACLLARGKGAFLPVLLAEISALVWAVVFYFQVS